MRTHDGAWNPLLPYLASAMQCPACGGAAFLPAGDSAVCGGCERTWRDPEAVLDMAPHLPSGRGGVLAPASMDGATWERDVLDSTLERLGPVDRDTLVAFAGRWLQTRGPGPILDLQTGSGWMARQLARGFGVARVIGIDTSLDALRRTQGSTRDPGMAWIRADLGSLPFRDGAVAAVTCFGDPDRPGSDPGMWREIRRVLAPGGVAAVLSRTRRPGVETLVGAVREVVGLPSAPPVHVLQTNVEGAGLERISQVSLGAWLLSAVTRPAGVG